MQGFSGFPPGKTEQIRIPGPFFGELLPIIDHLAEMKVTLYCFWALQRQSEKYPYVRFSEILADEVFIAGLSPQANKRESVLREGFERAVVRGTLLHVIVNMRGQTEDIYFMNTPKGRNAIDAIDQGSWLPGDATRPIRLIIERPNIFVLYEQNIGALTPMIADQLRDAEQEFPHEWIVEAIEIAVAQNARSWRYIQKILDRWSLEGKR